MIIPWWSRALHWLICRMGLSGGFINHDEQSGFWQCARCGRKERHPFLTEKQRAILFHEKP